MKPTKMRNNMIYRATHTTKSRQLGSALSKDLRGKYGKRSVRVVEGDNVSIVRGEFTGVEGKVSKVLTEKGSVTIEGIKNEKTKGEKYDVYIHASNLVVRSLNTDDTWRVSKLEGKTPKSILKEKTAEKQPKGAGQPKTEETAGQDDWYRETSTDKTPTAEEIARQHGASLEVIDEPPTAEEIKMREFMLDAAKKAVEKQSKTEESKEIAGKDAADGQSKEAESDVKEPPKDTKAEESEEEDEK